MSELKQNCSRYYEDDSSFDEPHTPCRCPVCGGWLVWEEKKGEGIQPVCHKCCVELITIPDVDEDGEVSEYEGKICPIGKPASNSERGENLRIKRLVNAGHRKWKAFL